MSIRRAAIFPMSMLVLLGASTAAAEDKSIDVSAESAPRKAIESGRYGDVSLTVVESFGRINVPSDSERGGSGSMQGSGWDLRFMMAPGVGAYYRWDNAAQNSGNHADWYVLQYAFGFAGRLHSTGRSGLWSIRTQSRLEWGLLYFQAGTNDVCTRSWAPLGDTCSGTPPTGNASGAGVGSELRLAGEVDFGPIALVLNLGATGYRRWSTGSSSVSIPGWFWMPTAMLHIGIALPTD